jgi:uncharacterized protein YigA (DUF484 family)
MYFLHHSSPFWTFPIFGCCYCNYSRQIISVNILKIQNKNCECQFYLSQNHQKIIYYIQIIISSIRSKKIFLGNQYQMTTKKTSLSRTEELPEEAIIDYLQQHPDFLIRHQDLLTELQHRKANNQTAPDSKLDQLHQEKQRLQLKLETLIAVAQENEQLNQRIQSLVAALTSVTGLDECFQILYSTLSNDFNTDTVLVRWFEPISPTDISRPEFVEYDAQVFTLFEELLGSDEPICGEISDEQMDYLFPNSRITSAVLIPLGNPKPQGLLAMGSQDAERFHANMGTDFLKYLGQLVSFLLKMWLRH